jgi:hypothetical protein
VITDDVVKVAIIGAIPPTVGATFGVILGFINRAKIKDLHVIVNSRLTQLLELTATSSEARGALEEKKRQNEPPGSV